MRATLVLTLFMLGQCVLPQTLLLGSARGDQPTSGLTSSALPNDSTAPARAGLNGARIAQNTAPKGNSKVAGGKSSPKLWSPNDYVAHVPLDLSGDYVPTEREVSGQGAMCGGLAPAAPAEPQEVEDEVDSILRAEGFEQGLDTKLPTLEEAQALVARRAAPESLLAAVKRLEEGKKKVRKARKQNRDFALAMAKWNATDFAGADKALKAYVKEFSKKPDDGEKFRESPWTPEALIHIADLAKFNGQLNEAEEGYKKVMAMTSDDTSEMSYEAHLKAYERWTDLYLLEGRLGEARPMLENIVMNDVHWRRRTWAQYWLMQLNVYYANPDLRLADLDCGTQALAALLVDLGRSRDARRVAAIDPNNERGFSLAQLKTIAQKERVEMVGFRANPAALPRLTLPALLHFSPPADAQAENRKTAKSPAQKTLAYGHYVVVRAYDAQRGLWSVLNPQDGSNATMNADQLAKEWSGAGLMLSKQSLKTVDVPAQNSSRWLALWPRTLDGKSEKAAPQTIAATPKQNNSTAIALLSSDEMRRTFGTCYVVHANSQNGERSFKLPVRTPCSDRGEPNVSIDPVDQNIFITDTPVWYNPAKGPRVEFRMAYNSLLASNYNGTVGNKWTHNYGAFLTEMPNQVTRFGGDGSQDVYTLQNNGAYASPGGVYTKLFKTGTHTYYLESPEGDREYYGIPAGFNSTVPMLLEQRDRWGQRLTVQYQLYGGQIVPWTLTDADGRITNFTYTSGRLTSIRVPDGRRAYLAYDFNGNLIQCTDVAGQNFNYFYDSMVVLTQLNTPQGGWKFVSEVQPYTSGNNGFNKVSIYDPQNPYPGGTPMVVQYDNRAHGQGTYSHKDRRGFETIFGVAPVGRIGVVNTIRTPEGYVRELTYNPADPYQPVATREPHTNSTLSYNAKGRLFNVTSRSNNNPNQSRTLSLGYNASGIDVQSVGVSAFHNGSPYTQAMGTAGYDGKHQMVVAYDAAGNRTTFEYTAWGAPLVVTTYQGNTVNQLDQIRYYYGTQPGFNLNRLVEVRHNTTLQAAFSYDGAGRAISMTDARGITVGYQYDNLDNVTLTTYPDNTTERVQYDCCSVPREVTDRSGRKTTYGHDALKRLRTVQDADGKTLQFDYDKEGNRISLQDANGAVTRWNYDADGRAVLKTYPDNKTERWNYNGADGRLVSSVNGRGQTSYYGYTAWDELTNINYTNSNTTPNVGLERDGFGRPFRLNQGFGLGSTSWTYDSAGRLASEDGPWNNDTIEYSYDARNNISQTRVGSNNGQDVVNYGYDIIGRLNSVSAATGNWGAVAGSGTAWNMTYVGWSAMPLTETRPNGGYSEWNYESTGLKRLTRVSNKVSAPSAVLSRFTYDYGSANYGSTIKTFNLDSRTAVTKQYSNNPAEAQTTTFGYNGTSMLNVESAPTTGNYLTPRLHKSYGYDGMGNRTSFTTDYPQQSGTATYNNLNQLTSTTVSTQSSSDTTGYGYDDDGNLTSTSNYYYGVLSSRNVYIYDDASRLIAIESRSGAAQTVTSRTEFVYDAMSRLRISRYYSRLADGQLVLQNEKRRVYNGMDVVQERDQYDNVTASYTRTGNIGGILARTTQAGSTFYGYDGAGNVVTLTNSAGAQVGSYTYDAFGNIVAQTGNAANDNPYRFSTKEQIGGLYSYGYRFYSPGLGRFINRDPIGVAGGANLYGFVGNNPINMVDGYGLLGIAVRVMDIDIPLGPAPFNLLYGRGGPDFLFDRGSSRNFGSDASKGYFAGMDGLSPLGSPYKDMGYYSPCDSSAIGSFRAGKTGQLAIGAVLAGRHIIAGARPVAGGGFRIVTSNWVRRYGAKALARDVAIAGASNAAIGLGDGDTSPKSIAVDAASGAAGGLIAGPFNIPASTVTLGTASGRVGSDYLGGVIGNNAFNFNP